MLTELYWVDGPWPGKLSIAPRPRGGDWLEHEIREWSQSGIDVVVSLLTSDEMLDLGLSEEPELCKAYNISFISFPIEDRMVPTSRDGALNLIQTIDALLGKGHNVVIHCRGGIGRSGLIAASLLVQVGIEPEDAIRRVSIARGLSVPETPEQVAWVRDFAKMAATLAR